MIKYIQVKNSYKANWLDDRGVLVGFDNFQQCCEQFGYRVYEKESGKPVFDDPDGLLYHFTKTYETTTDEKNTDEMNSKKNIKREYCGDSSADLFQVEMFPDDGKVPRPSIRVLQQPQRILLSRFRHEGRLQGRLNWKVADLEVICHYVCLT